MLLSSFVFPCLWGYVSAFGTKKKSSSLSCSFSVYSTVTDFAKLRGWSTLQPRITAIW